MTTSQVGHIKCKNTTFCITFAPSVSGTCTNVSLHFFFVHGILHTKIVSQKRNKSLKENTKQTRVTCFILFHFITFYTGKHDYRVLISHFLIKARLMLALFNNPCTTVATE